MIPTWSRTLGFLAAAAVAAGIGVAGFALAERYFLARAIDYNQNTLRLATSGLRGALMRFEPLPGLVADKADVRRLLSGAGTPGLTDGVNAALREINDEVGASDIYVMNREGLTIAASNAGRTGSFIGRNFSFRPYFRDAMAGQPGRYFALGTTSQRRGYYFSAPVDGSGGEGPDGPIGVVAVKMDIESLETDWYAAADEIIVTDDNGIIFMASQPDWLYRSLAPLDEATVETIWASRKYPTTKMMPLGAGFREIGVAGSRLATIPDGGRGGGNGGGTGFVMTDLAMPQAGWTIHILSPRARVTAQTYGAVTTIVLVLLIFALGIAYILQRRARLVERLQVQRDAQAELEKRVVERTADLNAANARLKDEVADRIAAEQELRKTQTDLIQAAKLAALGQMSAALSHEINQPLAAVKSYADNAGAFLDRDRPAEARDNISRISDLADRMADISRHLRNFARKPQEALSPVPVATIVNDALQIMAGRLRSQNVETRVDLPEEDLWVTGGQIRLQQVLVNLISNALDAMPADETDPLIEITAATDGGRATIAVRDNGPGIDAGVLDHIFDPFFTTKGINEGLGLGLSVSYNIVKDFGGTLRADNDPDGGAVFTIDLKATDRLAGAAE